MRVFNQTTNGRGHQILGSFEEIALRLNNFLPDYIPNWYSYNYDVPGIGSHIQDGGNDMYDGGNYVSLNRIRARKKL